ncbi:hypothetical protein BS47DRAFT_1374330 [Hydnum rufescens UP504]|uniref:NACHT domain-containing protein n=1 Tax=Hydnum rufescens UP504 TaxID=1448309 RepID=A0A9P6AGA8_9AGAM|nr:hypothetical protein BS47DRAFT_1374330 [Hydnum rufescens UP504]
MAWTAVLGVVQGMSISMMVIVNPPSGYWESLPIINVLPDGTSLLMSLPRALPPVYWLNGLAGIGKSTIAKTVAERAQEKGMLGATFFFSRSDKPLRDPGLVLPTLAFQLAQSDSMLMEAIVDALKQDPGIGQRGLLSQLQGLILTPLLSISPHRRPTLLILDALDECEEKGAAEILHLMFAHLARIPFLRVLITSRPQPHLSSVFNRVPNLTKTVLHDIEASRRRRASWLKKSGKLFIYAATAIRFIGDDRVQDPQTHLALILNTQSLREAGATPYAQLDKLYMEVLRNSLSSSNHREILRRFQVVVGSIVLLREPLPLHSLAEFIQFETRVVETSLRHLHSVIVPPSNTHEAPRIYHPSFLELITDPSRCPMSEFVIVAVPEQELRHAIRCFQLMATHLRRDVAGIMDPSLLNQDVDGFEEKVRVALPPEAQYACRYWASHLLRVGFGERRMIQALEEFSMRSILWWFEAMSLLGNISNAVRLIEEVYHWAKVSKSKPTVIRILSDSHRFILVYAEVIRASALHVYHSALPFTPHNTLLYKTYCGEGVDSVKGHSDEIWAIAFSPDGLCLASASLDHTVQLWNPTSGASIAKLDGHFGPVVMVAFSPDGLYLASGSGDCTVQLWGPISTESLRTLEGHSNGVTDIAFSPNGLCLASASYDGTVQLWNPISGHSECVTSIAFSPDGSCLASGSKDHTLRLWDPISCHSDWVQTIAFSPNGSCLASGSIDNTLRLWDPISGAPIAKLEGHSDWVENIAFSPNGSCLASGAQDCTLSTSLTTPEGHSAGVDAIAFSPNGLCLASASHDPIVKLWDPISEGHSSHVVAIAFSPNGLCLASASYDKTVQLWDPMSGASFLAIAFSPDGLCLASATYCGPVQLWNPFSGVLLAELEGHSQWVYILVFLPNGLCLAATTFDQTVKLWDPGHSDSVYKLAFSFDSCTLISHSEVETIIWDLTSQPPYPLASGSSLATPGHFVGMTPPIWSMQDQWIKVVQEHNGHARRICYIPPDCNTRTNIVVSSQQTCTWLAVGCYGGHVIILVVPDHLFA